MAEVWYEPERLLRLLGQRLHHGRKEEPGRNGVDADGEHGQLARQRQRHGGDGALGGRVRGLAHLALKGGHGGHVENHAALAIVELLGTSVSQTQSQRVTDRVSQTVIMMSMRQLTVTTVNQLDAKT